MNLETFKGLLLKQRLNDTMRYYLCPGATSMRKGINGLCGVVHEQMGCDVRNGDVFISSMVSAN